MGEISWWVILGVGIFVRVSRRRSVWPLVVISWWRAVVIFLWRAIIGPWRRPIVRPWRHVSVRRDLGGWWREILRWASLLGKIAVIIFGGSFSVSDSYYETQ